MKKLNLFLLALCYCVSLHAWWDPGHLVTAMIAYLNLERDTKERVDELTQVLQRDYPYVNHFITTAAWPDDLKAEGVRTYDPWHYTNIPWNRDGVALPDVPEVDVIWAINEAMSVLRSDRARDIDKARHLGFLTHFVGDIHQPLHTTSVYTNELPGGTVGGNAFPLEGQWRNLHMLWDDGCGFLSSYNDISPYGEPKEALTRAEIKRIEDLAKDIMRDFPARKIMGLEWTDPDFWALEGHKLAVKYGYRGINDVRDNGRYVFLQPGDQPSDRYLDQCQRIVRERLAAAGYRMAALLNETFGEE